MPCLPRRLALAVLLAIAAAPAFAHHGQDFLLVESPTVPHPGDAYFLANGTVALDGDAEEQAGFEPALLVGIVPRLGLELHAHTEKVSGEGWAYEATAPSLHLLLTDPDRHDGLKAGLSAEYEIAREADAADRLEWRLALERGVGRVKWGGNLIYGREQGEDGHFGAALGVRRQWRQNLSLGAEANGDFDRAAGSEVLGGAYWEHDQRWALKLGVGARRDEDNGWTPLLRVGLVLRLRD